MNKSNIKILISLITVFSFFIIVSIILTQNNFINDNICNKTQSIDVFKLGLNDEPQESGNLSTYQKFQEFWTEVYSEDALNWSYLDWRNYLILQIYGTTEDNLNSTIKNDPLYENNIDIFTIYVMGKYNGSLSDVDITNLKNQLIHNSVHIGTLSFLNHDDDQLKIFINIEVESSSSMWYVADLVEFYLKSENSSGKWYDDFGTHYIKVYEKSSLELTDPIPGDGNYKNHIFGPITIDTNTIEENISLLVKVGYFINFLMDDYVEKIELINLVDDDNVSPEIYYTYTGDYTDGFPGELIISALDASGLSVDPSGTFSVPNDLGLHKFTFNASDADNDRLNDILNSSTTISINITDDDDSPPEISYIYTGDYTDGNPGELIVNASDVSGLSLDPSGIYQIPNEIGNYKFVFTACDADNDRPNDTLNSTITVWVNITDDDVSYPEISYIYTGDYTDGNPGELIVNISDLSGLSLDSGGIYQIPNEIGNYEFIFTACDGDFDRFGDTLNITITVWVNITDDDVSYPEISYIYTGDYTDGNPGELIVNASDVSGLSLDPSGIYQIPNEIGNYKFVFTAYDADNDRPNDTLNSTITVWVNITDDDVSYPEISYIYTGDYTDANPGEIIVNASDVSGLSLDPSGIYQILNEIGNYKFIFTACDTDSDRLNDMLNSSITIWVNITDDDVSHPEISYIYTGDYTDANPGKIIVNASDVSGLSLNPSGIYQIPNEIGNYKFIFTACDGDFDRFGDTLNTTITVWVNITDDDISPPELYYLYTGNYTDGNPGELIVNASDVSGLSLDPSGIYQIPNEIGNYKFVFTACDGDADRMGDILNSSITIWVNITDDDVSNPEISYIYTGDYTDANPGEIIVNASDSSGLSLDPSGFYQIPNKIGNYKFIFIACDADTDRSHDILNRTIIVWINITDDDISCPEIYYIYTGNYTDANPGELIINASDFSGLSLDPSGIYQVSNEIGYYQFIFTACDADTDRYGDSLNTTIIIWLNIVDDDEEGPTINMVKIRNNRVYDYYDFIVIDYLAEDKSGISELYLEFNGSRFYDDNGDNQILIPNPRIPARSYSFSIVAIDADNDREADQEITQLISFFEVFDDDTTPPNISLYYDNVNYQISIFDNDGIIDSKATGEFLLIDEEGVILQSGCISQEELNYTLSLPLKPGTYYLEVYSTNNDLEWDGDEEYISIIFCIEVDLEQCFRYVDQLLADLIDYVDQNLCLIIADNIRFKLTLAQENLLDAYLLIKIGALNNGLFNELIVQGIIEFVEFETEFYNKIDFITEEIRNEMILSLHKIRNFIILLIGTSVDYVKGINCGYDIASIEVELLNLVDLIEEELCDFNTKYIEKLVKLSALQLELAVIKLSRGIDPDSTLSLAQQFIERAIEEVNHLLEKNMITEGTAYLLLEKLNICYVNIEEILLR